MPRKLKVYRTAVGFRDAYVAAASKAAALRAWGTQKDLFARGAAEVVDDPKLCAEPLSKPGEIVYRTRGSLEEQVAALGTLPANNARPQSSSESVPSPSSRKSAKPPRPRPSRGKVEAAEAAIQELERQAAAEEAAMQDRERALGAERKAMEDSFAQRLKQLQEQEKRARRDYEEALRKWEP